MSLVVRFTRTWGVVGSVWILQISLMIKVFFCFTCHLAPLILYSATIIVFLPPHSERDSGSMGGRDRGGRMSDMGPDKTDTDWRARPSADSDDSHRKDDAFGESEFFYIKLRIILYIISIYFFLILNKFK